MMPHLDKGIFGRIRRIIHVYESQEIFVEYLTNSLFFIHLVIDGTLSLKLNQNSRVVIEIIDTAEHILKNWLLN